MGAGDQVDVMHLLIPQPEHQIPEGRNGEDLACPAAPADLPVLAEHAAEIAAGEKYGAGALDAAYAGFFAKMGRSPGNPGKSGGAADTAGLNRAAFCPTLAGTIVTKNIHSDRSSESFRLFGKITIKLENPGKIIP